MYIFHVTSHKVNLTLINNDIGSNLIIVAESFEAPINFKRFVPHSVCDAGEIVHLHATKPLQKLRPTCG